MTEKYIKLIYWLIIILFLETLFCILIWVMYYFFILTNNTLFANIGIICGICGLGIGIVGTFAVAYKAFLLKNLLGYIITMICLIGCIY
jgi:fatty-acid desaturase